MSDTLAKRRAIFDYVLREGKMTADEVRELLREEARSLGSQRALARKAGVSAPFVSDVLKGAREPSGALLDLIGVERVVTYHTTYEFLIKKVAGNTP